MTELGWGRLLDVLSVHTSSCLYMSLFYELFYNSNHRKLIEIPKILVYRNANDLCLLGNVIDYYPINIHQFYIYL